MSLQLSPAPFVSIHAIMIVATRSVHSERPPRRSNQPPIQNIPLSHPPHFACLLALVQSFSSTCARTSTYHIRQTTRTMRPDGHRDLFAGPGEGPAPPFPLKLDGKVIKGFGRGSSEVSYMPPFFLEQLVACAGVGRMAGWMLV
jgi:hypothetical protein